eukprot:TRINITY_DN6337_c0_g1_i1.p1 TRINITY_DN6337_c0_g1~~TRINITY_DN6337_c0_g1_i1.p1  ORF type:complete len:365 (-),score=104.85 TRINITY_DN6337_c0_g1_i1:71-1165(-)
MANRTDPHADTVHGANPQFLVDRIIRVKIYNDAYWKEFCFGLTTESVIDEAAKLDYVGGTYGGRRRPAKFLCLFLKLLQIQPDEEVVMEYIRQPELKYLRALGCAYLRITARYPTIFKTLEPLYADYRKLRYRDMTGKMSIIHMDEFIDWLLHEETICDVTMPQMPKREILEANEVLEPYQSVLEDDLEDLEELEKSVKEAQDARDAAEAAVKQEALREAGLLKQQEPPPEEKEPEEKEKAAAERVEERPRSRERERRRRSPSRRSRERSRSRRRARSDSNRGRREKKDVKEGKDKREKKEKVDDREKEKEKKDKKDKKDKKTKYANKADEERASGHSKKDKDGLTVDEWNDIRKEMGLKPLRK